MVGMVGMVCSKVSGTIRKNSDYFNFVAKVGMLLFISILSPDIIILDGLYNQ